MSLKLHPLNLPCAKGLVPHLRLAIIWVHQHTKILLVQLALNLLCPLIRSFQSNAWYINPDQQYLQDNKISILSKPI